MALTFFTRFSMKKKSSATRLEDVLRCPYCHKKLFRVNQYTLRCCCDTFPIVHNIAYLKKGPQLKQTRAIALMKKGYFFAATLLLLDSRNVANYLILFAPFVPLFYILRLLEICYPSEKKWWQYLRARDLRATHLLSLATLGAIQKNDVVVDICCGQGNFLKYAAAWTPAKTLIGIDSSLFLLLIARKYFVPTGVVLVCADINKGVPLQNRHTSRAFMNDCFMYVDQKTAVNELLRILKIEGEAFLTHVHNQGKNNLGQGLGISPLSLRTLTGGIFHIQHITDEGFFSAIVGKARIPYNPIGLHAVFAERSYSYYLASRPRTFPFTIPHMIYTYTKTHPIDLTEDTNLYIK